MRRVLDILYRLSGALGAICLAGIAVVVFGQVSANILNALSRLFVGDSLGLLVPSYADFAGFFLAAGSFFALAYTLHTGGHIRVSLVLQGLGARARHAIEIWCCAVAAAMAGYFAYYCARLTHDSWHFGDMSTGMLAIPLWIPQTAMTLGLIMLTIALVDEFVTVLRGDKPAYEAHAHGILNEPASSGTGKERDAPEVGAGRGDG